MGSRSSPTIQIGNVSWRHWRNRANGPAGRSTPKQGKGYEAYIEGRVLELGTKAGRKEFEQQWKELRRGWYVGGESFAEKLKERLQEAVQGWRRESHSGPAKRAHDQAAAEQSLGKAMRVLNLETQSLKDLPKGAPEKVVLAWWLRERTTVPLSWVSQRLAMGHYTRVTQAISRMARRPGRELEKIKRRLLALDAKQKRKCL